MRYLGIDLAWSETASSGVCVLDSTGTILDEDQIAPQALPEWVLRWRADESIVAIDGPIVVPRDSGFLRPVERELHHRYGRYHAGPFPGGAASTAMRGRLVSPAQGLLDVVGSFVVDPTDGTSAHRAIEVFPAPTWIELFDLPARVVYKRGRLTDRVAALATLRTHLEALAERDPPLLPAPPSILDARVALARSGRDWKAVEDIIDARLCAYVALLWGRGGAPSWTITGDGTWRSGYVVVPQRRA